MRGQTAQDHERSRNRQMIVSEYVRGLKNNYVRIRELSLPDERKYQYCIMKRGGITGFLPFEIRYIDSDAYMYYDITSRQNISTLYSKKPLDRQWVTAFFSSMKRINDEALRFLLDPANLIWNPSNIYQDLKTGNFGYLYVPYLDDDNGMQDMMDFMVSHIDFSDDELVRCVYSVADQYKSGGEAYLREKVYSDISVLVSQGAQEKAEAAPAPAPEQARDLSESPEPAVRKRDMDEVYSHAERIGNGFKGTEDRPVLLKPPVNKGAGKNLNLNSKKNSIVSFIKRIKEKDRLSRGGYDFGELLTRESTVAEESVYSDSFGDEDAEGTVYVDLTSGDDRRRLKNERGRTLYVLGEESCVIGKQADESDLVIDEPGISRIHSRVFQKEGEYFLEDLNSTNGTFVNGTRLRPYEKRILSIGDEIGIASSVIYFS